MNTAELITSLAQKLSLSKTETTQRLEVMLKAIIAELLNDNSVYFTNFGSLEVKKREERISVNPASGKRMLVPPKLVVKFKPSNVLKDKLKGNTL
ncbi:MAG: HU family DNA-binding protein [Dysgonamonadaceae bacterium]|jgi:nucleoid DNA-binding protein|nr:HU family DNA-binding protein [Dysgonamonadaceae bacterium]